VQDIKGILIRWIEILLLQNIIFYVRNTFTFKKNITWVAQNLTGKVSTIPSSEVYFRKEGV